MSLITSAKVISLEKHPNANKLKVCKVTTGDKEFTIVCGATNVSAGMITILAQEESVLPSGKKIIAADLRGIASQGMLCSPKDLGISNESGLITLSKETELAKDFKKIDNALLSSTPWFQYELIDQQILENNQIRTQRDNFEKSDKVIAQTYWNGSEYIYRKF